MGKRLTKLIWFVKCALLWYKVGLTPVFLRNVSRYSRLLFKILKLCAGFPLPLTGGVSGRLHISPARHEPGSSATLSLFPLLAVMQLTGKNILF